MKVGDLVKALGAYSPEAEVLLASDAEGNAFHDVDSPALVSLDKPSPVIVWPLHNEVEIEEEP